MLNSETRRRIDACRDILVGKLPSPQAQVEQITLALMYKFMNDMDRESMELGGKPQFFAKDFADYSWDRITDKRLSGVDRIKLYSEGIEAVNKNEAVPELFREIFKNAFLPYRDPETFNLFAKEISGFEYEHSEDLGDAYEYLLSIMSSQGDAGQFRTPRHIIDFMVEVVRPRVGETVLDPACGTGGFLISAYKHMRAAAGRMTPAKLEKLHKSIEGYDISPDMVRLSRVNMYLHQFPQPAVYEYDTLSDESRWAAKADVILANPPFMTPKGGIRPHKKFGVKANRSEVLFVDYFMEHLTAEGRAAVIVPEGIIFQSAGAYVNLRKLLLNGYLWAVASLPAGLFNPYSGVKTSILFMDRKVAALGGPVLFAKVEADGFDLGAQRRANGVGDLPAALELLLSAHDKLTQGAVPSDLHGRLFEKTAIDHLAVPREMILAEGDNSLSMERYRPQEKRGKQKWPMVKLGDVCEFLSGGTPSKNDPNNWNGDIPWVSPKDMKALIINDSIDHISKNGIKNSATRFVPPRTILIVVRSGILAHSLPIAMTGSPVAFNQDIRALITSKKVLPEYVLAVLAGNEKKILQSGIKRGGTVHSFQSGYLEKLELPLPPLSVQEEIVAEISRYQAVIDGARAVVDNWQPSFAVDPEWPVVKMENVCEINPESGLPEELFNSEYFTYIDISSVENGNGIIAPGAPIKAQDAPSRARRIIRDGDVLLSTVRPNLKAFAIVRGLPNKRLASTGFAVLRPKRSILSETIFTFLLSDDIQAQMIGRMGKGAYPSINQSDVAALRIPLPPLSVQKEIVARIEAERELVRSNEKLIELMKQHIEETIARVWE
jgi:type I restriction enzyme M protein